jgi:uncharacterized protein
VGIRTLERVNRRRFLKVLGLGVVSVIGVGIGTPTYGWLEAHRFGISRHAFKLKGLEIPLKLVQLSDLHFGRWHGLNEVRAWVDATLKEQPDLIVITGDIVDGRTSREQIEALAQELGRLTAPIGVFAVLGNHDYFQHQASWDRGTGMMISSFERAGVRYLRNAGTLVRDDLFLAGVDDFWMGNPDPEKAFRDAPPRAARLLLNHNPDLLPEISPSVGLTLCGHTHGGQIRAPFGVGLYSISKYGERFQMGFVKAPAPAFVSRGLGTTGPPVRTFCPAELVVLNLIPA